MKYFLVTILISLLCVSFAYAQVETTRVQFTRERNQQGKWVGWTDLIVVWETEPTPAEDIPDHMPTDDDAEQEWLVPFSILGATITWYKFTFSVDRAGEYAVRLSGDEKGILWSDPESCVVKIPARPVHSD